MSRPVTRPIVSVSTPCQSFSAASESQPSEFVQKPPPVLSWSTRRISASAAEQSGPTTTETESVHSLKRAVPGIQSASLPPKSKTRRSDNSRKLDGITPVSRLSSIHSPVSAAALASSAGTSPVSSLSPSPRSSNAAKSPRSGTMGPFNPLSHRVSQRTCPSSFVTMPYQSSSGASLSQLSLRVQLGPSVAV